MTVVQMVDLMVEIPEVPTGDMPVALVVVVRD